MNTSDIVAQQQAICARFEVPFNPPALHMKVGVSSSLRDGVLPYNGLRHPEEGTTCGWYLWADEELSEAPDFFMPLHVEHLSLWRPEILKYLALPPGWRFLVADNYEDVWFDEALLRV